VKETETLQVKIPAKYDGGNSCMEMEDGLSSGYCRDREYKTTHSVNKQTTQETRTHLLVSILSCRQELKYNNAKTTCIDFTTAGSEVFNF
jgi:hypothetical protein